MTIRFAGARAGDPSPLHAWRCRSVSLCAANENERANLADTTLVAALRHFGQYGLAASDKARDKALTAHGPCSEHERTRWISIYRHFDRRMADRILNETTRRNG